MRVASWHQIAIILEIGFVGLTKKYKISKWSNPSSFSESQWPGREGGGVTPEEVFLGLLIL